MMKTWRNFFHPAHLLQYAGEKRILKKFYLLPYIHLNLTKNEISVILINMIYVTIILYLIINLSAGLLARVYSIRGSLYCNSHNVIYIISWKNYGDQYVRSTTDFKARFRIHKSEIRTMKDRCSTGRQFNDKCCDRRNPHIFLKVQIIESVQSDVNLEGKLWEGDKYWKCQLFTNTHGMNSVSDLYSGKRKGCRENWWC